MNNNDILRRIRYVLDLSDAKFIQIFANVEVEVNRQQISCWLKKEDDLDLVLCEDIELAAFLSGLIIQKRGKRDGEQPPLETKLSHNIVFRKLKIAFDLKAEDILDILNLAEFRLSKHELSAFFRKPGHKHYRVCKDQVLRNFLTGLQIKHRNSAPIPKPESIDADSPWNRQDD